MIFSVTNDLLCHWVGLTKLRIKVTGFEPEALSKQMR